MGWTMSMRTPFETAFWSTASPSALEAVARRGQRVRDRQRPIVRGGPVLDDLDRLVAPVDAVVVGQRVVLDVHVQAADVVGRDHLLVGGGDLFTSVHESAISVPP